MSIIIPAHNEAQVLGRLLDQLVPSAGRDEFDIVVVANGCTDNTSAVAAAFGPLVRVLSLPVASKHEAIAAGNRVARGFPRLYVDADVELRAEDARLLAEALRCPQVLGAAPELVLATTGQPWPVRWYFDVWQRLPEVRQGLFGRGVIGVSSAGYARIAALPPVLADDLAASLAFRPDERMIVIGARVVVHPPGTFADLLRIRTRAAMGVDQIEQTAGAPTSRARTRPTDLFWMACRDLRLAPRVAVFLWVTLLARRKAAKMAARSGYTAWLRDQSSRDSMSARYGAL